MESVEDALIPRAAQQIVGSRFCRFPRLRWTKQICAACVVTLILVGKTCFQEEPGAHSIHRKAPGLHLWESLGDCDSSGRLHFREALHRNLGGFGPDDGEESIVYRLTGENGTEVEMVLVALNQDFNPWHAKKMGIRDGFAVLSTVASSRLVANVSFRDPETHDPMILPQFALSFYDMNWKHKVDSKKVVRVLDVSGNWTDAIRSNDSSVDVHQNMNVGSIVLSASERAEALDGPSDPKNLSPEHLKRSVSVRFSNLQSFKLQLETGERDNHQLFQFTPEAALLCSATPTGRTAAISIPNRWLEEPLAENRGQIGLRADGSAFQQWFVALGDVVDKGDQLYSVIDSGNLRIVSSPAYGQVVEMLSDLLPGDVLKPGMRLMIIQRRTRILWSTLGWIMAGCGCAGVLIAAACCGSYSPAEPPPLVMDEDDFLVLEFRTPTGWMQTGIWKNQPLGLGFHKSLPAIVAFVGDDAQHSGVLEGDELVKLGTEKHGLRPIRSKSYDEFWSQLSGLVSQLPELPRLILEFETVDGRSRQLEWKTKPLGLAFNGKTPVVTEVHEEALHMNVRVGDQLTRYGLDKNMLLPVEGKPFDEVLKDISSHMADFPTAVRMICVFELPDKSLREFMWHARPLGLSFGTASPPVVSKVERPADVKGIKEGYILRRFGSDFRSLETTEDQSTSKILADMQKFANLLPDATLQDVKEW